MVKTIAPIQNENEDTEGEFVLDEVVNSFHDARLLPRSRPLSERVCAVQARSDLTQGEQRGCRSMSEFQAGRVVPVQER
jgi:hypothetical protein